MNFRRTLITAAAAALVAGAALAGNSVFFTSIGDQTFPFSAPLRDGTAGAIDNMIIGATTPRAATFTTVASTGVSGPVAATTLSASGAVTGAGFTALFASPPAIGGTAPAAGAFTTLTGTVITASTGFPAIPASDASLDVTGLAAAQGGAVALTGGTSSTSGNAGGAVTATGGTPGATGVGGAVTLVAGDGGATSGTGGASALRAGAGTGVTTTGGAAAVTGGAGGAGATTSAGGVGGAATLAGGAGGAKVGTGAAAGGAGGAAAITGGTGGATASSGSNPAGAGGTITLTGGTGGAATAGTGNGGAGGDVNLVPGTGGATTGGTAGTAGLVKVNGDANLTCGSYYFTGTPAATNQVFFIANRAYRMTSISQVHSTAAGGTSTLDVTKDTSTGAPASGTALGQAAFNLNATANTVQNASLNATLATITLAAGDRLAVKFNNAIQSSAGVVVTACMAPV